MRIDVFEEALELRNKVILCEDVLKYLSDKDAALGQKYKETLALFAKTFEGEFMYFVHQQLEKCSMMFDELHCCPDCECENKPTEFETPPTDAKFQMDDKVKIIGGDIGVLIGRTGTIVGYISAEELYQVKIDGFSEGALPLCYAEDELEPYVEPEENPDEPKDEKPEGPPEIEIGTRVMIASGEYEGKTGTIVEIGFDWASVQLDDMDEPIGFTLNILELITTETPDEDGGDTDPADGE